MPLRAGRQPPSLPLSLSATLLVTARRATTREGHVVLHLSTRAHNSRRPHLPPKLRSETALPPMPLRAGRQPPSLFLPLTATLLVTARTLLPREGHAVLASPFTARGRIGGSNTGRTSWTVQQQQQQQQHQQQQ